jgi:hypothetical protein
MSLSPTSCKLFLGRRDKPPDLRARRGAASAGKIVLELTAYPVRVVVETGTGEADQRLLRTGYRP